MNTINRSIPQAYISFTARRRLSTLDNCVDIVKNRDFEGYLSNLLLPSKIRSCSFALRAFNAEISTIRDNVSERVTGLMRMKYWEEIVNEIHEDPLIFLANKSSHPVAYELALAVYKHNLPKEPLVRMLKSRERFVERDEPFKDLKEVEEYSQDSFSSLYFLLLRALNSKETGHSRHAANQLGKAQGYCTLIRSVPYHASKRRILLPRSLLVDKNISLDSLPNSAPFKGVIEGVASRVEEHVGNCRFRAKYLDSDEKVLFLPLVAIDSYLSRLHKAECNVFHSDLQKRNNWLPILLYLRKFQRTY